MQLQAPFHLPLSVLGQTEPERRLRPTSHWRRATFFRSAADSDRCAAPGADLVRQIAASESEDRRRASLLPEGARRTGRAIRGRAVLTEDERRSTEAAEVAAVPRLW
jgi:hypothetical protein